MSILVMTITGGDGLSWLCARAGIGCPPLRDAMLPLLGSVLLLLLVAAAIRAWRRSHARHGASGLWLRIHRAAERRGTADPACRRSHVEQVAQGVAACHTVFGETGLPRVVEAGDTAPLMQIAAVASVIGLPMVADLANRALGLIERRQAGRPVTPAVRLLEAEFAQMGGLACFADAANAHIRAELARGAGRQGDALTQT